MRPFAGDDELLPCGPMRCRFIAFFTLTLYFTGSALAGIVTGNVTGVLDGDTIEVLNGHHADRIRLSGIDCPEKGQAYGKKAKQAASALVFGKEVTLQTHGYDKYGRTLADVILPDGTNVNQELVKAGLVLVVSEILEGCKLRSLGRGRTTSEARLVGGPESRPPMGGASAQPGGRQGSGGKQDSGTREVSILLIPRDLAALHEELHHHDSLRCH